MGWELSTHEFELREGHTEYFEIGDPNATRKGPDENNEPTLVVVEALSGRAGSAADVLVMSRGANFESSQPAEASTHVLTGFLQSVAGIAVQVKARLSGRFRVSILRLRKKLGDSLSGTPCDLCKSIAKLLAMGLLAGAGYSMPGVGEAFDALTDLDVGEFLEKAQKLPLWPWIEKAELGALALVLLGPLLLCVRTWRAVEDWVFEEACRTVGACTDHRGMRLRRA